ncbi:MAG: Fic family protein, partial [Oscillospiraceae bacterium]|nr:Fic family protein [Oscillospiraceae bacterium]
KHAWEFVMYRDVIATRTDYYILCHIARLVNEGFFAEGGRIRGVPVTIGGTSYVPPMPIEYEVKETIASIVNRTDDPVEVAIELCLYCMKTQIFNDGNKRAAVIFANHYLIGKGEGLLVIPEKDVPEFKQLLVKYYEDLDRGQIVSFMKEKCRRKMNRSQ